MLCKKPYMAGNIPFGCGQCLPCRINRSRQWMWRQYLESLDHEENAFVTLTYDDKHLPATGTLEPEVLSRWIKRFRKAIYPTKIRYFAVGEYGEGGTREWNPHYHLSLFGVSGATVKVGSQIQHYGVSKIVAQTWGLGYTFCAEFNETTAQYVAGYVTKKMTEKTDVRLQGRWPEFARMSNRPGIGANAMRTVALSLIHTGQSWKSGDVPQTLVLGKRKIRLGRYLLKRLRLECGFTDEYIKELRDAKTAEKSLELLSLFQNSGDATVRETYGRTVEQTIRQAEARHRLYKKREAL